MSRRVVYLHVGAPKTGTTYLQTLLWQNQDALRERGVLVPGRNRFSHFSAGYDLRGVRKNPADPRRDWQGAWDRLVTQIQRSYLDTAVISDERLASSTEDDVRRAVAALEPAEVHVIYVTRDPAGLLCAAWQEHVKHADRRSFDAWLTDTLKRKPHQWYWKVHDVAAVLRRWGTAVPKDRLHVVTLPPKGSEPGLLWQRFCSVLGISPDGVNTALQANVSLGRESVELLRRVNQALPRDFPEWQYLAVARNVLASQVLAGRAEKTPITMDPRLAQQVRDYTDRLVTDIKDAGVQVVGDLGELDVAPVAGEDAPAEPDLTAMAVEGLAGVLVHMGELRDDVRRLQRELDEERAKRKTAVRRATRAEATTRQRDEPSKGRLKRRVVELGDRSRLVGGMLSRYRRLRRHRQRSGANAQTPPPGGDAGQDRTQYEGANHG